MHESTKTEAKLLALAAALAVVAVTLAEFGDFPLLNDGADAEVTAALVAEACIRQFGPGELHGVSSLNPLTCVSAAGAEPRHVLSMPVSR